MKYSIKNGDTNDAIDTLGHVNDLDVAYGLLQGFIKDGVAHDNDRIVYIYTGEVLYHIAKNSDGTFEIVKG